ncbi:hypothetical protein T484DRAFT_1867041 [Baffinella frigidus]|nr:hypothetical protein T484DRAFT_1867041 [Cryptophyta sp. CCMP2293]
MIRRRNLRTRNIKTLVLDETGVMLNRGFKEQADEMLNQGFKEQIYDVYRYLPPSIQARIPPIQYLARLLTAVDGC